MPIISQLLVVKKTCLPFWSHISHIIHFRRHPIYLQLHPHSIIAGYSPVIRIPIRWYIWFPQGEPLKIGLLIGGVKNDRSIEDSIHNRDTQDTIGHLTTIFFQWDSFFSILAWWTQNFSQQEIPKQFPTLYIISIHQWHAKPVYHQYPSYTPEKSIVIYIYAHYISLCPKYILNISYILNLS